MMDFNKSEAGHKDWNVGSVLGRWFQETGVQEREE